MIIDQVGAFEPNLAFLGDSKVIIIDTGRRMSVEQTHSQRPALIAYLRMITIPGFMLKIGILYVIVFCYEIEGVVL